MQRSAPKVKGLLAGTYRIVEMEAWDRNYIDMECPGYIRINNNKTGEFHFGTAHGDMDCRFTMRDGLPAVEFTWEGSCEMDPETGGGWAVLDDDMLTGRLMFHMGEDSGFVAQRKK